jgi:hypothetical protein
MLKGDRGGKGAGEVTVRELGWLTELGAGLENGQAAEARGRGGALHSNTGDDDVWEGQAKKKWGRQSSIGGLPA